VLREARPMLDSLTQFFSIATIAALYLIALFNIGYFYVIGYHFIGVIDISNIVYTLGLVVAFVLLFALIGTLIAVLFGLLAEVPIPLILKQLAKFVSLIGLVALLTYVLYAMKNREFLKFASLALPAIGAALAWFAYANWNIGKKYEVFGSIGASFVLVSVGFIALGISICEQQLESPDHYDLLTKSGGIPDVAILRSSSAGFIFAEHGKILFIPSSEVRLVSSTLKSLPER
jgi:hypothetical protein